MTTVYLYRADAPEGPPIAVEARTGQSLMQAAVAADVGEIVAECGGLLTCATCHVYVREPHASRLPPASADEHGMLEFAAAPVRPNSRLSCQVTLDDSLDGLAADLPPNQY